MELKPETALKSLFSTENAAREPVSFSHQIELNKLFRCVRGMLIWGIIPKPCNWLSYYIL